MSQRLRESSWVQFVQYIIKVACPGCAKIRPKKCTSEKESDKEKWKQDCTDPERNVNETGKLISWEIEGKLYMWWHS